MNYIYIDVLLLLNIYVNYFLLQATSRFTHTRLKIGRCIGASVFGCLFSLTILFPQLHFILGLLIKLIAAAAVTAIAFGFKGKNYLKLLAYFYGINFVFAGVIFTCYILFKPSFMHFNNSFVYIDFSLTFLLIATIIAYGIICLVRFFMDKTKSANGKYIIVVHHSGRVVSEQGLADSGNILLCPFTGKSVIVFSKTSAGILLGQDINTDTLIISPDNLPKGIRLIPFKTVGNCGVMPVFRPDEVIIQSEYENKSKKVDALIGVGSKDTCAVFNPCLLH